MNRKNKMKHHLLLILLIFSPLCLFSEDFISRGEELFMENKPAEALPLLIAAVEQNPTEDKAYIYLGVIYEQLGEIEKAVEILQKGLDVTEGSRDKFYFNLGNNYFRSGKEQMAEEMYTQTIKADYSNADAYLNRANTRVNLLKYEDAVSDYRIFLTLRPDDADREAIQSMMSLLDNKIEEDKQRRIEEEERKQREAEARRLEEEARRKAEEERRRAEEERQKRLLDSVLNSLETVSEDTKNLSADSEEIQDYDLELDIED